MVVVLRIRGAAMVAGCVTACTFVDWIGFRLVFSDLVRIAGTQGRSGRWLIVVVQAKSLGFRGFAAASQLVAGCGPVQA